jgi:hypothetical protein
MQNDKAKEFLDTVQLVSAGQATGPDAASASPPDDYPETQVWPEAADFQCSESASLFAGTQPAPLSVV